MIPASISRRISHASVSVSHLPVPVPVPFPIRRTCSRSPFQGLVHVPVLVSVPVTLPRSFSTTVAATTTTTNNPLDDPRTGPCYQRSCRPVLIASIEGLTPYARAWRWQQQILEYRIKAARQIKEQVSSSSPSLIARSSSDILLLVEHPPVYTLGRGADINNVLFDTSHDATVRHQVYRVERGGEVTYHCPGQIVVYPLFDLHHYKCDLHWYVRTLEDVVITVLAQYGIKGERESGFTGVWVGGAKICAIGIQVSKWITCHGLALNINCDVLPFYQHIVACGLKGRRVVNLASFVPDVSMSTVRSQLIDAFRFHFNIEPMIDFQPLIDPIVAQEHHEPLVAACESYVWDPSVKQPIPSSIMMP